MLKRLKVLSEKKFIRNVAIVASGTAVSQAITMAFAPVITRLYGPEAFGMLGTFTALLAIVTPLAALSYPIAMVMPKSDTDAKDLARLSTGLALFTSTCIAIIIWITSPEIAKALNLGSLSHLLFLVPLVMVFASCNEILKQWLIRQKAFQVTARVAVIQSFIINSAKVAAGFLNPAGSSLILLATVAPALNALLLCLGIRKQDKLNYEESGEKLRTRLGELAARHRDFPMFRAPQIAINATSEALPVLMLASLFGPAEAGFYTLGRSVLAAPTILIANSVGDVFYPRITEAVHKNENIYKLLMKATLYLAAVGALPFTLVIAFGPWIFSFIFGAEWVIAGEYARWLALWLFFNFINKPVVAAIPSLKLQGWLLSYELFSTGSKVLALYVGFKVLGSDIYAVALMCSAGVIAYLSLIIYTIYRARITKATQ